MSYLVCDTDFLIKSTTIPLPSLAMFLAESGYELATIDRVKMELEGLLKSRNQVTARKAGAAIRSISSGSVKVLKSDLPPGHKTDADTLLIDLAAQSSKKGENVVIATLDHTLLSILEKRRLPYLTLRDDRPLFRTFS